MPKNLIVFSRTGIHHADKQRGEAMALFIPSRDQTRTFNDIGTINTKSVKERYGGLGQAPLWRQRGSSVTVYGLLPDDLQERRFNLEVFLPQDFVPEGTSVFYFVISEGLTIHGVRTIRDDGTATWGVSKLNTQQTGAIDFLMASLSERVASGAKENICIAVHDDKLFRPIQEALKPFAQDAVRFTDLSLQKTIQPLYLHRDHGLVYIVLAMVSSLLLLGAIYYAISSFWSLDDLQDDITNLERQIEETKRQQTLGNIRNPNLILDFMEKPLEQRPSSLIYAAGEAAAALGELQKIELQADQIKTQAVTNTLPDGTIQRMVQKILLVQAKVAGAGQYMLVDQEQLAKGVVAARPWIRSIQRTGRLQDQDMALEIGVRAD